VTIVARLFIVLILAVLTALPVVAYADPLDPTWAGGFWDDDDFDYVVLLVSNLKATMPVALPRFDGATRLVAVVAVVNADVPFIECRLPFHRRGPPLV
jgi:hypothetical protein